jgi:uroporphyrinogen decarboxylase
LIPAEAMGLELAYNPGPVFANPVRTDSDVEALVVPDPEATMPFSMEMLRMLRQELPAEKTIIGFAGTPFTVATYMIEGRSSPNFETARSMLYKRPELLHRLLDKLAETTILYLRAQIRAGAEIVMLFDSSAHCLSASAYREFALAYAKRIIENLADTDTPVIYFAPGSMSSLSSMGQLGAHVIGVDWRIGLDEARRILGPDIPVQGNLDPAVLLGTKEAVRRHTKQVLALNASRPGHIFNLGHGVHQLTPPENVEVMVATVREEA